MIGPEVVKTGGPIILLFTGGTSNINVYNSIYLQVNRQKGMIMLKREFK